MCPSHAFLWIYRLRHSEISWRSRRLARNDHLKGVERHIPTTQAKSQESPALRGFVGGRRALATTSLYPSTKIEQPGSSHPG